MTQKESPDSGDDRVGQETEARTDRAETEPALAPPLLLTEPSSPSAEADPVINAPKPETARKHGGGFIALATGGVLAAVIGYGLAQYVPGGWPLQDTNALQAQIETQTKDIQALKAALANADSIMNRVTALESTPTNAPQVDLTSLQDQIAALEAELSTLKSGTGDANVTETLRQMQARIDALELGSTRSPEAMAAADSRVKEAEAQAAASKAEAEATALKAAQTVALSRIASALDSGAAFADALSGLGAPVPEALAVVSEAGAPSIAALQAAFPDAARNALDAALRSNMGGSWTERATTFLKTQTGARSTTPHEGSDPDAILSRAEAALGSGDLQTVLTELSALPMEAQTAIADWQTLAQKRLAATQAFTELSASLAQ